MGLLERVMVRMWSAKNLVFIDTRHKGRGKTREEERRGGERGKGVLYFNVAKDL